MEKDVKIRTSDGKYIYGTFNVKGKREDSLVIFVHGLICDQNDHLYLNGSRFLNKQGFATFRFNLYGHQKNTRKLQQCTVEQHGKDVTTVINYFRKRFHKVFLIGHSMGGPSILFSDASKVAGLIFWDPSIDLQKINKTVYKYNQKLDSYRCLR